jgi:hypothetical protein
MNTFIPKQDNIGTRLSSLGGQSAFLHFDEEQEQKLNQLVSTIEAIFKDAARIPAA